MNADTLEYVASMVRDIDTASAGFQLSGHIAVYDNDEELTLLGHLWFNGDTETTFQAAA